jgi:hypothetical protein
MIIKVNHIVEFIALLVSIFCYKKTKHSYLQWMMPYLAFVLTAELIASYILYIQKGANTYIYIWINTFSIIFYNYCFYNLFEKERIVQKIIIITASVLVSVSLFLFFFVHNYVEYKNYVLIVSGIFLSCFSCLFLYRQFMKDDLEVLLIKQSGFWIAAGVLLFYSGICTIYALHPLIEKNNLLVFGMKLHNFFARALSVFLYFCLSAAILVWEKKRSI